MTTIVPASLLELPQPWNRLDQDPRDSLSVSTATRLTAVEVIGRCLEALDALPEVLHDEFPEYITIAWSLWSAMVIDHMPTFDEFREEPITEWFRQDDPDVSASLVRRYAIVWIRKEAWLLMRSAQNWLFLSMRDDAPDPVTCKALHDTLERWWRADQLFATNALDDLWTLDRAGSTELLRRIVGSPEVSAELHERLSGLLARPESS